MEEVAAILETGAAAAAELAASGLSGRRVCANCRTEISGRFCSHCGQAADSHRRSVGRLVSDFVKDIASFDSRVLRTIVALIWRPGELALAFREGRTQRYVPPVRLYLFTSLLFFVALSISSVALIQFVIVATPSKVITEKGHTYIVEANGDRDEVPAAKYADGQQHYNFNSDMVLFQREGSVHAKVAPGAMERLTDKLEKKVAQAHNAKAGFVTKTVFATLLKLAKDPAALNGALTAWIPRALFVLLPLFALIIAAFYWRQRKTLFFVDHLVFSLGFHTFGFVLLLAAAALAQIIAGETALMLMSVVLAVYLLLAMKRFYGQSWWWTAPKWLAVLLLYTFFCIVPAFAGVIVASVMWG
jgi:ABC-type multidrug transport system fused ATPase/permease subunit